jgi:hypothetical protein
MPLTKRFLVSLLLFTSLTSCNRTPECMQSHHCDDCECLENLLAIDSIKIFNEPSSASVRSQILDHYMAVENCIKQHCK